MTRISTFCVLSSVLAVIALSANGASAVNITVHTPVPRVIVHVPQPKVTVHTPQLKVIVHTPRVNISGNHGITGTGAKVVRPGDGNQPVPAGGPITITTTGTPGGAGNNSERMIEPPVPLGGASSLSVVGHTFGPVSGPPVINWGDGNNIIGYKEGNPDRPFIIGSVYNATPSFSFNIIDPAAKASVVSVVQPGGASSVQFGNGTAQANREKFNQKMEQITAKLLGDVGNSPTGCYGPCPSPKLKLSVTSDKLLGK